MFPRLISEGNLFFSNKNFLLFSRIELNLQNYTHLNDISRLKWDLQLEPPMNNDKQWMNEMRRDEDTQDSGCLSNWVFTWSTFEMCLLSRRRSSERERYEIKNEQQNESRDNVPRVIPFNAHQISSFSS